MRLDPFLSLLTQWSPALAQKIARMQKSTTPLSCWLWRQVRSFGADRPREYVADRLLHTFFFQLEVVQDALEPGPFARIARVFLFTPRI